MRPSTLLLMLVLCGAGLAMAVDAPSSAGGKSVQFDGQTLVLAFEGQDPGATIEEYIPAGENLESWTKLAAIREFDHIDDPEAYAAATIEQIKKDYPKSPSSALENPQTGTVVLDFVVWPPDASLVEFNVFRYEKRDGGGLVSQQYAVRAYGDDAEQFLKDLTPLRERLVTQMAGAGLKITGESTDEEPAEPAVP